VRSTATCVGLKCVGRRRGHRELTLDEHRAVDVRLNAALPAGLEASAE